MRPAGARQLGWLDIVALRRQVPLGRSISAVLVGIGADLLVNLHHIDAVVAIRRRGMVQELIVMLAHQFSVRIDPGHVALGIGVDARFGFVMTTRAPHSRLPVL